MNEVGPGGVERPDFLAEAREIGRQDRGGDSHGLLHGFP